MPDTEAHLAAIRRDVDALGALVLEDPPRPVPSCPDWTLCDLGAHVAVLHRWVARIVGERITEAFWERETAPADPADLVAYLLAGPDLIDATFAEAPPDLEVWNWAGAPPRPAFWPRRMAQEGLVHLADAQLAAGHPVAVDSDLAADGIEELLTVLLQAPFFRPAFAGAGESIHLHRTDGEGEWSMRLGETGLDVDHEHAKGDLALRGPAPSLLLVLWGRYPLEGAPGVEAFGDEGLLDAWRSRLTL